MSKQKPSSRQGMRCVVFPPNLSPAQIAEAMKKVQAQADADLIRDELASLPGSFISPSTDSTTTESSSDTPEPEQQERDDAEC